MKCGNLRRSSGVLPAGSPCVFSHLNGDDYRARVVRVARASVVVRYVYPVRPGVDQSRTAHLSRRDAAIRLYPLGAR